MLEVHSFLRCALSGSSSSFFPSSGTVRQRALFFLALFFLLASLSLPLERRRPQSDICRPTLGYYSSWPLFALTHHLVIWWCEEQVYPDRYFDRYAVLGDDVLIADQKVAQEYEKALQNLGVQISHQKSLISESGAAEFAKRFYIRGLSVDLSPISIRALMNPFHPYGLM